MTPKPELVRWRATFDGELVKIVVGFCAGRAKDRHAGSHAIHGLEAVDKFGDYLEHGPGVLSFDLGPLLHGVALTANYFICHG